VKFDFNKMPASDAEVIKHHSRSFSLAAKLLPASIRADVEKLYAWCRWCDDAVDEAPSKEEAKKRIEILSSDVKRISEGKLPLHAASQWLADLSDRYEIPSELPLDLLQGMATDIENPIFETVDELLLYCYRAAGTVGLMMCRIMGVHDKIALENAEALGIAMQLTNIARDLSEDWQTGRRYVPKKWLSLIPLKDMTPSNGQVRMAVQELLDLADRYYSKGYQGLKQLPDGSRMAIRLAGVIYQEIGNEIRRQDLRVMSGRLFVPLTLKLKLGASCLISEIKFRSMRATKSTLISPFRSAFLDTFQYNGKTKMNYETRYLGYLGLSLTFVMATTMFLLMGLNPKETVYEGLPWIYSGGCALIAAGTGIMARRMNQHLTPQPVKAEPRQ
jgi:phytoene synthase